MLLVISDAAQRGDPESTFSIQMDSGLASCARAPQ